MKRQTIAMLTIAGTLVSCGSQKAAVDESKLYAGEWRAVEIRGEVPAYQEDGAYINFDKSSGETQGNAGCNILNAPFKQNGASLKIENGAMTRMMCLDGDLEQKYVDALEDVRAFNFAGDTLQLLDSRDKVVLKFVLK
jgi:heat shock protein HslJ